MAGTNSVLLAPSEIQGSPASMHESSVPPRVLYVDDEAVIRRIITRAFEREGIEVRTAAEGSVGVALAVDWHPDVILMDLMMPGMDGYQTMTAIREKPEFRRLPIIALTAKAMKGDREKCLEAGASDYLAKPVNTEQLLSALRMWLHR